MAVSLKKFIRKGQRIRVLVVDDSVVIRRLVANALGEDPDLEVVGTASNGRLGLARMEQLNPDVVTLDIEMPEMTGLDMLRHFPVGANVRVIMFSTLTEHGASATLEALSLGASDYVTKASNAGSLDQSMEALRAELIPKIKQFFRFEQEPASLPRPRQAAVPAQLIPPKVVVIGVSTGGPAALAQVVPAFPADFPLPILVVQHMPPVFTRLLAERLNAASGLTVAEAVEGASMEPGSVWIAPGDYHVRVRSGGLRNTLMLDQGAPVNSCRPAVDVMFESVAEVYGGAVISVVLTGMGYDGLRGVRQLRAKGAWSIAQDEESSVVWGMPGAIVREGLASAIVPINQIASEVVSVVRRANPQSQTILPVRLATGNNTQRKSL